MRTTEATSDKKIVPQHPRVTVRWALDCLEQAVVSLPEGPAERRVRAQLHQLLLALERERLLLEMPREEPDRAMTRQLG
jgi:hypothetical protein